MDRLPLCCTACAAAVVGLVLSTQSAHVAVGQISKAAADSVVEGVFEGRTPCSPIANGFTGFPAAACEKIKWEITLYRDAVTGGARSYRYRGTRTLHNGTWSVTRGAAANRAAIVYELEYDGGILRLLAADENLLLLMDADGKLMVGDASWSYTFNRTDRTGLLQLDRRLPNKIFEADEARQGTIDATRFASFFSGRPDFVYLINARHIASRDSLHATFAGLLSRHRRFEPHWTDRSVQMLSQDVGVFTGAFETRAEPVTGEPWRARGVVTFAAVRENAGWRVVNWHTTEQALP